VLQGGGQEPTTGDMTLKPNELPSKLLGWIKIAINPEAKIGQENVRVGGAIGFHCHYGHTCCFAIDHDQPADDSSLGLLITNDSKVADEIYQQWWHNEDTVIITRG
jgi:hypothetical protein